MECVRECEEHEKIYDRFRRVIVWWSVRESVGLSKVRVFDSMRVASGAECVLCGVNIGRRKSKNRS